MNKSKTVFSDKSGEIIGKVEESSGEFEAYYRMPSGYEFENNYYQIGSYNSFELAKQNLHDYLNKFNVNEEFNYRYIKYIILLCLIIVFILFLGYNV